MTEQKLPFDTEVARVLGLDGDIEKPFLKIMYIHGLNLYLNHKYDPRNIRAHEIIIPGKHIDVSRVQKESIPEYLVESTSFDSEYSILIRRGVKAFLEGFADQAYEQEDYRVAIYAYDAMSDGGILKNEELLEKLNRRAKVAVDMGAPDLALKIGRLVQEVYDKRKAKKEKMEATSTSS